MITSNITRMSEITFGTTNYPANQEKRFEGYIKEFRWWSVRRSGFLIDGFKNIEFDVIPTTMIAYWKLKERNDGTDTVYTDSASSGAITQSPVGKTINKS